MKEIVKKASKVEKQIDNDPRVELNQIEMLNNQRKIPNQLCVPCFEEEAIFNKQLFVLKNKRAELIQKLSNLRNNLNFLQDATSKQTISTINYDNNKQKGDQYDKALLAMRDNIIKVSKFFKRPIREKFNEFSQSNTIDVDFINTIINSLSK